MDQPIKSSGITKPTKMELQENLTDDYDYDVQESFNTYIWEELVPTLVVYILTLVIGVTGNFLIIFTIARYRRMKSITNVFLASLASADLLLILVCIPVKVRNFLYIYIMLKVDVVNLTFVELYLFLLYNIQGVAIK